MHKPLSGAPYSQGMVSLVTKAPGSCSTHAFCSSCGGTFFLLPLCPLAERIVSDCLRIAFSVLTVSCSFEKNAIHHCTGGSPEKENQ